MDIEELLETIAGTCEYETGDMGLKKKQDAAMEILKGLAAQKPANKGDSGS